MKDVRVTSAERSTVVIVAGKVPEPIRSGLDLRTRSQVHALSRSHNVVLVSMSTDVSTTSGLPAKVVSVGTRPQPSQEEIVRGFLANPSDPFQSLIDESAAQAVEELVSEYNPDAVIVSRIQNWVYADSIHRATSSPVILDLDESADQLLQSFQNLPYQGIARSLHLRYTRAMSLYEKKCRVEADAIMVSSVIEKDYLDSLGAELPSIHIAVNAVDVPTYKPSQARRDRPRIAFTGNLAYPPNYYAAREIIDHIAPACPALNFVIAGSHAPTALRRGLPDNVTVLSPVEDMGVILNETDIALMPLRAGGGTRFKALEAMAAGIPCLGTAVAFEGLDVHNGSEVVLAETLNDIRAALMTLTTDRHLRRELVQRGHDYVASHHSIYELAAQLTTAIGTIAADRAVRARS